MISIRRKNGIEKVQIIESSQVVNEDFSRHAAVIKHCDTDIFQKLVIANSSINPVAK